jgi:hypothetical protein
VNVTLEVFLLATFLSVTWGIYLISVIQEWLRVHDNRTSKRGDLISAFRRLLVALAVWLLPFAFFVRTGLVLTGNGDLILGQIAFFALTGANVVGSLFAVISLRYD